MSNRASRRAAPKIKSGQGGQGGQAVRTRPVGEHGVEVDTANGLVHVALHAGEVCVSVAWSRADAQNIVQLIQDAINHAGTPAENIVQERGSGLVVARQMP